MLPALLLVTGRTTIGRRVVVRQVDHRDQLLHQRWGTLRSGARRAGGDCEVPAIRGRNGTRVLGMVTETILRVLKDVKVLI
jgi:hypothetical protein